jgi:hypothetical protein
MPCSIVISAEQRDVLYGRIVTDLSGIDGVYLALEEGDFAKTDQLSQRFCDDLQLVRSDLGWGKRSENKPIELKSSPEVLRRVLERFRGEDEALEEEANELDLVERARRLIAVCSELLADLEASE